MKTLCRRCGEGEAEFIVYSDIMKLPVCKKCAEEAENVRLMFKDIVGDLAAVLGMVSVMSILLGVL